MPLKPCNSVTPFNRFDDKINKIHDIPDVHKINEIYEINEIQDIIEIHEFHDIHDIYTFHDIHEIHEILDIHKLNEILDIHEIHDINDIHDIHDIQDIHGIHAIFSNCRFLPSPLPSSFHASGNILLQPVLLHFCHILTSCWTHIHCDGCFYYWQLLLKQICVMKFVYDQSIFKPETVKWHSCPASL